MALSHKEFPQFPNGLYIFKEVVCVQNIRAAHILSWSDTVVMFLRLHRTKSVHPGHKYQGQNEPVYCKNFNPYLGAN